MLDGPGGCGRHLLEWHAEIDDLIRADGDRLRQGRLDVEIERRVVDDVRGAGLLNSIPQEIDAPECADGIQEIIALDRGTERAISRRDYAPVGLLYDDARSRNARQIRLKILQRKTNFGIIRCAARGKYDMSGDGCGLGVDGRGP